LTPPPATRRVDFAPGRLDVGAAVDWIDGMANELGADERQRFAAKLCAEELLANVLRHGGAAPAVAVTLARDGDRLTLAIEDGGAPFDPTQGPAREALGDLDAARPGGWGLALIRRFAHDFNYRRNETGNIVQLSFPP
jgi:serine/threonine-protein kinase RsbW